MHDDVDLEIGAAPGAPRRRPRGAQRPPLDRVSALGSQDFLRLRIGVGRPGRGDPRPVADYVLSPFAPEDDAEAIVARAADAVEALVARGPRGDAAPLQLSAVAARGLASPDGPSVEREPGDATRRSLADAHPAQARRG